MTFNKNIVCCRTRQFIDEELILAIRNFSENLPIIIIITNVNKYTDKPLYSPAQDKKKSKRKMW